MQPRQIHTGRPDSNHLHLDFTVSGHTFGKGTSAAKLKDDSHSIDIERGMHVTKRCSKPAFEVFPKISRRHKRERSFPVREMTADNKKKKALKLAPICNKAKIYYNSSNSSQDVVSQNSVNDLRNATPSLPSLALGSVQAGNVSGRSQTASAKLWNVKHSLIGNAMTCAAHHIPLVSVLYCTFTKT